MKPRVVLLIASLDPGGAEAQVFRLALELNGRGWAPAVVSLLPLSGYADALREAGVQVFSLGMRRGIPDPRGFLRLLILLNRLRPRVLHSHMFHANLMARLARLFLPIPVVISTLHSTAESGSRAGKRARLSVTLRDWVYRLTDSLASAVAAVSAAVAERHASSGAARRAKLLVIPNGVDVSVFRPDAERRARTRRQLGLDYEFVWLAAGRLIWKKNWETLLRAFAKQRGAVLLMAGEGPQEAELKGVAAALGIDARFLGRVNDMPGLMNAADAFALSSVVEGLPVALLEAAASGLPAVAADAGGVRDVLDDGEAGWVVPVSDPESMAAAMARVQSLPLEVRERMCRAARARAQGRFDILAVVSLWEAAYRDLLEKSRWM